PKWTPRPGKQGFRPKPGVRLRAMYGGGAKYAGPKFPTPSRTPMAALVPKPCDFWPKLLHGYDGNNLSPRSVVVSKWTSIRFNSQDFENANGKTTYNA
ncbi:MAG: hypothetical protein ACE5HC_04045, partial [Candidatus Binatia bacterium]